MSSYVLPVLLSGSVPPSSGDFFAPVITNVSSGTPTSSGATITWTTDENSNSQVVYGTTSAYGSSTTLHAVSVTSHSEAITGLSSGTLYHYAVKSADASGNLATSGDNTFTTSSVDLTSGLIHYWKMDSTAWADSVGSHTLTPAGSPLNPAGLLGNAFDTNSGGGILYDNTDFDLSGGSATIAGWLQPYGLDNFAAISAPFLCKGDAGTGEYIYTRWVNNPANEWVVEWSASGARSVAVPSPALDTSGTVWYFYCARYNSVAQTMTLSINADAGLTASTSSVGGFPAAAGSFASFGQLQFATTQFYNGKQLMDEIGIWNRALTDAEVTLLYNSGTGRTYPFT